MPSDRSRRKAGRQSGREAERQSERQPESRGDRFEAGLVWLYGVHAVLAAVANPRRRCRRLLATEQMQARIEAAAGAVPGRPTVEVCDRRDLAAVLSPGAVHQGVAALVTPLPAVDLDAILAALEDVPLARLVILDQASDPRNVGAVIRSAAAFGVAAVIGQDRHAPAATGALAKAAAGGLERVPLVEVVNIARAMRTVQTAGFCCVGLDAAAPEPLARALPQGRVALVLGSEGHGLRRLPRETCDVLARIPIDAASGSLNLSVAASIALYELARGGGAEPTSGC